MTAKCRLGYLAQLAGGAIDADRAIALMFAADRFHVREHGRPVGADAEVMIATLSGGMLPPGCEHPIVAADDVDLAIFSETEREALTLAYKTFGHLPTGDVVREVAVYPGWAEYRALWESDDPQGFSSEWFFQNSTYRESGRRLDGDPTVLGIMQAVWRQNLEAVSILDDPDCLEEDLRDTLYDEFFQPGNIFTGFSASVRDRGCLDVTFLALGVAPNEGLAMVLPFDALEDESLLLARSGLPKETVVIGQFRGSDGRVLVAFDCNRLMARPLDHVRQIVNRYGLQAVDGVVSAELRTEIRRGIASSPLVPDHLRHAVGSLVDQGPVGRQLGCDIVPVISDPLVDLRLAVADDQDDRER